MSNCLNFGTVPPVPLLQNFKYLSDNPALLQSAADFMSEYNLLPNDALIIAICKLNRIPTIADFDSDFIVPCRKEGICLLQTPDDFEALKESLS